MLKSIRERLEIREKQQIELPEQLSENVAAFLKLKEKKSELDQQSKRLDEQIKLTYAPIQEALKGAEKGLLVEQHTRPDIQRGLSRPLISRAWRRCVFCIRISARSMRKQMYLIVFTLNQQRQGEEGAMRDSR